MRFSVRIKNWELGDLLQVFLGRGIVVDIHVTCELSSGPFGLRGGFSSHKAQTLCAVYRFLGEIPVCFADDDLDLSSALRDRSKPCGEEAGDCQWCQCHVGNEAWVETSWRPTRLAGEA